MTEMTLEQKRADFALRKTRGLSQADAGNYASLVNGFPATILTDGLGQSLATLLAKSSKEKGSKALFDILREWLCRDDQFAPYSKAGDLMEALIRGTQDQYVRAQAEAMALLVWLKKFSCAYLEREE